MFERGFEEFRKDYCSSSLAEARFEEMDGEVEGVLEGVGKVRVRVDELRRCGGGLDSMSLDQRSRWWGNERVSVESRAGCGSLLQALRRVWYGRDESVLSVSYVRHPRRLLLLLISFLEFPPILLSLHQLMYPTHGT